MNTWNQTGQKYCNVLICLYKKLVGTKEIEEGRGQTKKKKPNKSSEIQ